MKSSELAAIYDIPERTVRDIIDKAERKAWPGFYRYGRHLFADRQAFERSPRVRRRKVAEFLPIDGSGLSHTHDGANHSQTA